MTLPGPPGVEWALGLLLWAAAAAVVGEFVRALAARTVGSWSRLEGVERLVLDFYLGGATMYLLAALPTASFVAPVVFAVPVAAGIGLVILVLFGRRGRPLRARAEPVESLLRPAAVIALLSGLALFVFELAIALPVGTGNTYDSTLLTLYVSLLVQHHTIPLSFSPYVHLGLVYPQGTTVWLAWAQLDFGLPPARTSLLVTPLFLALAPLGAFVFGRRAFASDGAGVAFAVMLAALGSWTRVLVGGSNDFIFAFPLVLLLAGQSFEWLRGATPSLPDAVAFGVVVGYSAALNPVGAEWLLPSLLLTGFLVRSRYPGAVARWAGRWGIAAVVSLVALLPTLIVLLEGRSSPALTPGAMAAPAGTVAGINSAQFVGSIDPFLFRPTDVWLSPLPILRAELAVLFALGLALLLLAGRRSALARYLEPFRSFVAAGIAVNVVLLALLWAASTGFGPGVWLSEVTIVSELSISLFTLYTFVAGAVLVLLFERVGAVLRAPRASATVPGDRRRPSHQRAGLPSGIVPVLLLLVLVVPGLVLTPTELPPVLGKLYQDFGNVSAGDFALLSYAGTNLPGGARVLIAPGSAAGFLPGYAPDLVLLYPLVPNWQWVNASYRIVVSQLTNATLNATGLSALAALDVAFVVVTGANTVLWPPFSAVPMLSDPATFPLIFHSGDAYLFGRNAT